MSEEKITSFRIVDASGQELSLADGQLIYKFPPPPAIELQANFNAALRQLRQSTVITWTVTPDDIGSLSDYPNGPIVEGSIEPLQG